jgi:septal ring factor EnvC (AmiA/AmiB activator)
VKAICNHVPNLHTCKCTHELTQRCCLFVVQVPSTGASLTGPAADQLQRELDSCRQELQYCRQQLQQADEQRSAALAASKAAEQQLQLAQQQVQQADAEVRELQMRLGSIQSSAEVGLLNNALCIASRTFTDTVCVPGAATGLIPPGTALVCICACWCAALSRLRCLSLLC